MYLSDARNTCMHKVGAVAQPKWDELDLRVSPSGQNSALPHGTPLWGLAVQFPPTSAFPRIQELYHALHGYEGGRPLAFVLGMR
jgi:hypothetical protein